MRYRITSYIMEISLYFSANERELAKYHLKTVPYLNVKVNDTISKEVKSVYLVETLVYSSR